MTAGGLARPACCLDCKHWTPYSAGPICAAGAFPPGTACARHSAPALAQLIRAAQRGDHERT
jgi:hypothetical protein